MMKKLCIDFGSGYNPKFGYKTCDVTTLPQLDFQYDGKDKIVGVSAQTVEQALLAQERGADYLGVGAVFPTSSKDDAVEVDHETVKAICEAVDIPVIAIGGISKDNVQELAGCGLCGIAVISAIFAKPDIKKAAEELKEATAKMVEAC